MAYYESVLVFRQDLTESQVKEKAAKFTDIIKELGGKVFEVRVCVVNGALQGLETVLRRIKEDKNRYHFIEVMNCPGGCVNGGGQPVRTDGAAWLNPTLPIPVQL